MGPNDTPVNQTQYMCMLKIDSLYNFLVTLRTFKIGHYIDFGWGRRASIALALDLKTFGRKIYIGKSNHKKTLEGTRYEIRLPISHYIVFPRSHLFLPYEFSDQTPTSKSFSRL